MKFLVLAVLVGVAAALPHSGDVNPSRAAQAMKLLTTDAKDMHSCQTDADCSTQTDKPHCCKHMKLCMPADAHKMEMMENDCTNDSDCKPMRRCMEGKCHFSGPKACDTNTDCLQQVPGMTFDCTENAKTAPGKRCYAKCTMDTDCHECHGDHCRIPEEFRAKIGCCGGHCQKKSAC